MSGSLIRRPFKTRLYTSIIVWLIIVFVTVSFGFIFGSKKERRSELPGAQLPIIGLNSTQGKITKVSYHSDSRRGTFVTPTLEFETGGHLYRTTTVRSYSVRELPFSDGQHVEVAFLASEPAKAWLKWEYDELMAEYNSLSVRAYDSIGPIYNYLTAAIVLFSALFLTVNLFVPLFGLVKR